MLVESDAFSDAEHKTAIQDNAQLRRRRKGNLALIVAEGNNIDARDAARLFEHMRDVVDQELGGIGGLRPAREMHADANGATARDAPERHRRVDSRGKQAHHRARASDGKAPDAGDAARVDIGRVLHNFDPHRKVRVLHLDFYLGISLTQTPADNLVDLHRVHGEIGVVAARVHLEARKCPRLAHREDARLGHLIEVALALEPARDTRGAGNRADGIGAFNHGVVRGSLLQEHAKTPRDAVNRHNGVRAKMRLQILQKAHLEF